MCPSPARLTCGIFPLSLPCLPVAAHVLPVAYEWHVPRRWRAPLACGICVQSAACQSFMAQRPCESPLTRNSRIHGVPPASVAYAGGVRNAFRVDRSQPPQAAGSLASSSSSSITQPALSAAAVVASRPPPPKPAAPAPAPQPSREWLVRAELSALCVEGCCLAGGGRCAR